MAIIPLGVVASAEVAASATIAATLTANIGQTTPAQTAVALVIVQTAHASLVSETVTALVDDAPASQPRYACYGYPINPNTSAGIFQTVASGPPISRSMATQGFVILGLNALLTGATVTATLSGVADYARMTVLGYKGLRVDGDPLSAPPFNIGWGPNNPFFGADGGIRTGADGDGFTPPGYLGGGCWSALAPDAAPPLTDFIAYVVSEFIGDWNAGVPIPPTVLTFEDAGVTLRESYYAKGPPPISTIIGDQPVTPAAGPYPFGGCTDVVPMNAVPAQDNSFMQFFATLWESGLGPPYCPVANRCHNPNRGPCAKSGCSGGLGSHCP